MALNEGFASHVLENLEGLEGITLKKMFGGAGLYCEGTIFGLIDGATLYLKVDDSNRSSFEKEGMGPFKPFPDKPMVMPYYEVPPDILEDPVSLVQWSRRSLEVKKR